MTISTNKNRVTKRMRGTVFALALASSALGLISFTSSANAYNLYGGPIEVCEDYFTGELYNCNDLLR